MSINNTNGAAPEPGVPIVDFGKFLDGGEDDREYVAMQIDDAFRNAGFVYLKGHGVPREMIMECFEWVTTSFYFICPYLSLPFFIHSLLQHNSTRLTPHPPRTNPSLP
jgi:hypothetical protein